MKVTSLGHAGLYIETLSGTILCDPWFTPAYFGSWFPFPRNDTLDADVFSSPDYLYISHAHRDHLDPTWLRANVDRSATVILPAFGIDHLESELRAIGFDRFLRTKDREIITLDELRLAVVSLAAPNIGPMGDSALVVGDASACVINQNDAHPTELSIVEDFGGCDAQFLQYSGAIWYPMVYELPADEKAVLVATKRERQFDRATAYVKMVGASHVFPSAGPPCFLDPDLFHLNDLDPVEPTIFPDATVFCRHFASVGFGQPHLVIPGSTATIDGGTCAVEHPVDPQTIFGDKATYLRSYQADMADVITAERNSWPTTRTDVVAALSAWFEPLLANAKLARAAIGAPALIETDDAAVLIDFPAGTVRPWAGEEAPFRFRIPRPLLEAEIEDHVADWCNDVFLSCRFEASRDAPYNEHLYTFFKSLTPERMAYAEQHYARELADDVDWIELDGHVVERYCPHQQAELTQFGEISNGVLTCAQHGWQYDIETGECLTSEAVHLRIRRT